MFEEGSDSISIVDLYYESIEYSLGSPGERSREENMQNLMQSTFTFGVVDVFYMIESTVHQDYKDVRYRLANTAAATGIWYGAYQALRLWEYTRHGRAIGYTFGEVMAGKAGVIRIGAQHVARHSFAFLWRRIPAVTAATVLFAAGSFLTDAYYNLSGMHIGDMRFH